MTVLYFGCDDTGRGWKTVWRECTAHEVRLPVDFPPTLKTLNTWRVSSPKGFAFVLHTDSSFVGRLIARAERGEGELTEQDWAGWELTLERARALAAKAIILSTPASFMPSAATRALISAVAERASQTKYALIWEPEGLWAPETTLPMAEELGLVLAIDPFLAMREELEPGTRDACFIVTERSGMRRRFDQYDFEELVYWAQRPQRVFTLLRGRFQWEHAKELRHVIRELSQLGSPEEE